MKRCVLAIGMFAVAAKAANAVTWDEVRTAAMSGNVSLKQAEIEVQKATESIKSSRSGYLPSINASYSKDRSIHPKPSEALTSNRLALKASQNLFAGLADKSAVERAEANKLNAEASKAIASSTQRAALRKIFDNALYFQEAHSLARRTVARRSENVRIVNLRYDGGLENKSSALKTQAAKQQAEADEKLYQASLAVSLLELSNLCGKTISEQETVEGSLDRGGSYTKVNLDTHPKLVEANASKDAAAAGINVARSGWFPSLTADATAYRDGKDSALEPSNHFSVGMTLTVPLFNPTQSAQYRQSALDWKKAELQQNEVKKSLELDLKKALVSLEDAKTRRDIALKVLEASKMQAEVYRQRYTLGMISFQDWDAAESDFIKAERELLSARHTLADAWTDIESVHGKTLEDQSP